VVPAVFALGTALSAWALLVGGSAIQAVAPTGELRPVWTEVQWPFPIDPWGKGKAFRCKAADCGTELKLYLRPKLGFCNCTTGVADDADLDRMGDLDLIGGAPSPSGAGRPITVGAMHGRSRTYALTGRERLAKSVISMAFNERCDMIAATTVVQHDRPATIEPAILEFLNSATVLRWVEMALGL
jgi:hypothetical protein